MKTRFFAISLGILFLFVDTAQAQTPQFKFEGRFDSLTTRQQALVKDWTTYVNESADVQFDPRAMYDQLPQSFRTTFEAVTNALQNQKLSDASGRDLGVALDLVTLVEQVAGQIEGKRGDEQFRIYVQLRPDALGILQRSTQFRRGHDNTIYHHGYPLNYGLSGGEPSIQFSMTPDGKLADIDVDYRSSGFPKALLDGHLTAANSDVRAGGNYRTHSRRWTGLQAWWRNLFGIAEFPKSTAAVTNKKPSFPTQPPTEASTDLPTAARTLLSDWLIEGRPDVALAFFDPSTFTCISAPFSMSSQSAFILKMRLYRQLQLANQALGDQKSLDAVVSPLQPADPGFILESRENDGPFHVARVPSEKVPSLLCDPSKKLQLTGNAYSVDFQLRASNGQRVGIHQYWHKRDHYWTVFAFQIDPDFDSKVPKAEPSRPVPAAATVTSVGDPQMTTAAESFFDDWFVRQDLKKAMTYLDRSSYACLPGTGNATLKDEAAIQRQLRNDFAEAASLVGHPNDLNEVLKAVPPWDPRLRIVQHPKDQAFAIIQGTSDFVASAGCSPDSQRKAVNTEQNESGVFVTSFTVKSAKAEGAALLSVWRKINGQWKIVSWHLLER